MSRNVDRIASRTALKSSWRGTRRLTIKQWSRLHRFSDDTVKAYFYGVLKDGSPTTRRIEAALEKDGFLRPCEQERR